MQRTIRLSRFQKAVPAPLPQAAKRRVLRDCRRLATCFEISKDLGVEAKTYECLALRDRMSPAEMRRRDARLDDDEPSVSVRWFEIETWFSVCFSLDSRGDILKQAEARARRYSAEFAKIADRLGSAQKRRQKARRVSA
jgi:hypothetical protein